MFRRRRYYRIFKVLRIILESHGTAFKGIFIGEGDKESMTVRFPSQFVALAEINVLWACPIAKHDSDSLIPARKTVLAPPRRINSSVTSAHRNIQRKRQNIRNRQAAA